MAFLKKYILLILPLFTACQNIPIPSIDIIYPEVISWDIKTPCSIQYKIRNDSFNLQAGIKARGGLSSRYGKHSYSLELNNKFELCGLPADDDWILNANYIDKTFMRHKISYDIFREMSPDNLAPKSEFAEVFLNGKYNGLYVIMEEVNGGLAGLDKSDPMAMIFKDPPIFYEEVLSWVQDSTNYYQQKFPVISERNMGYVLDSMKKFMYYSDETEFAGMIEDWFDIENVIDWHIMLLFSYNGDGVRKNFYLYKKDSDTPFRFALWDYDHSFGRDGDNELNMMERDVNLERSVLLKRLMESEKFNYKERLAKRWFNLRKKNVISVSNFQRHIYKADHLIRPYVERNFDKWPLDSDWYYDDNNYQEELDLMLEFVRMRIDYLDEYFKKLSFSH